MSVGEDGDEIDDGLKAIYTNRPWGSVGIPA